MPRPNRTRSIASEDNLARRITYEREQRNWSYSGLAQRMTAVGCGIDQSALYKVEKGNPRRRISVDELVALSEVFAVPVAELLMPPELWAQRAVLAGLERYRQAQANLTAAKHELYDLLQGDEHIRSALAEHLTDADLPPIPFFRSPDGRSGFAGGLDSQIVVESLDVLIVGYEKRGQADLAARLARLRHEMTREDLREDPTDG